MASLKLMADTPLWRLTLTLTLTVPYPNRPKPYFSQTMRRLQPRVSQAYSPGPEVYK